MKLELADINFNKRFIGLDISADSVRMVVLEQGRKGVRLRKWGTEPVVVNATEVKRGAGVESGAVAVRALKQRLRIDSGAVVTALSGPGVRHLMIKTPILTETETGDWLAKNLQKYLPPAMKASEVRFSFHICQEQSEQQQVLLSIVRREFIDQWLKVLEPLNLNLAALSAGSADVVNSLVFSENGFYHETQAVLHLSPDATAVSICESGVLVYYQEIFVPLAPESLTTEIQPNVKSAGIQAWQKAVKEILVAYWQQALGKPVIGKIILTGDELLAHQVQAAAETLATVEIGQPLQNQVAQGKGLNADFALAAGLAVKGHFPQLNSINFLPPEMQQKSAEIQEKQKALRWMLVSGAAFLLLWALITIFGYFLDQRLAVSEDALTQMNSRILAIEKLKRTNQKLKADLEQTQSILVNRSQLSQVFGEISRIMPEKVWLRSIATPPLKKGISESSASETRLLITGLAFSENEVARMLSALESSAFFRQVRLIQTESLSPEEILKRTKIKSVGLVRFEMSCEILKIDY